MKSLYTGVLALLVIAGSFASIGIHSGSTPWRVAYYENVLGTSMEIKVIASSERASDAAEAAALAEIKRLNGILSGYESSSEFSRWTGTRDSAVHVSPDLMEVLQLWDFWRDRSGGALNPAAEAVSRVWKQAEAGGRMPTDREMAAAAKAAQQPHWSLLERSGLAIHLSGAPLMLNSFTKSYVIDRAASAAMRISGVSSVALNIGGDIVVRGTASDTIDVADPRAGAENGGPIGRLTISDRAVATSGNYRRGFVIGGRHYSHIVDPRTGHTAEAIASATVVARDAVEAGALATAFCVLSPEESRKLAASVPGAEYLLVAADGAKLFSPGWNALQTSSAMMFAQAAPQRKADAPLNESGLWNSGYELAVDVQIPQTQGFGARRPYLAVWIEDKDHFPVRTLAVWFQKARWLNELRAWYRDDRLRAMSEGTEILNSVTSATRSPGKYTFKWDGKDNAGKTVKAGRYTVLVEAAREHGGYSLDRREMNFIAEPSQAQLPPDAELGAVTLDYHKVAR